MEPVLQVVRPHLLLLLQQQLCDDQAQREEGALLQGMLQPARGRGGALHPGRAGPGRGPEPPPRRRSRAGVAPAAGPVQTHSQGDR